LWIVASVAGFIDLFYPRSGIEQVQNNIVPPWSNYGPRTKGYYKGQEKKVSDYRDLRRNDGVGPFHQIPDTKKPVSH